jgi:hypothetical protein
MFRLTLESNKECEHDTPHLPKPNKVQPDTEKAPEPVLAAKSLNKEVKK